MPPRIVMTGAAGYIGRAVARRLSSRYEVVGIDLRVPLDPPCTIQPLDITDAQALRDAVVAARPEAIVHLAALGSVVQSMRDPGPYLDTNIGGTASVAQAAIAAGTPRVVFTSTGGALYGEPDHSPVSERDLPAPVSIYGASKLAAERVLASAAEEQGLEVCVLRPGNVYGGARDDDRLGVVDLFARRVARGEEVTLYGDGADRRDFVHREDVVTAVEAALAGSPGTCNIATGVAHTTEQVLEAFGRRGTAAPPVRRVPRRAGEFRGFALSPERAAHLWGWRPAISFEAGADRVWADVTAAMGSVGA